MILINNRIIDHSQPCFVIAEAGVNHNGDLTLARKLIDVAIEAKADAVKFQTFKAERLVCVSAKKANYQLETTNPQESQLDMLRKLELTKQQHIELIAYCKEKNILFLSTPFDEESADLLHELNVPLFKIPSGEITNIPFLKHIAKKGKPMIVSTGMSCLAEVEKAIEAIEGEDNKAICLLHCVSNYPAKAEDVNLKAISTLLAAFSYPTGYSDHTLGIEIALAACARGACVIEKHFTLDKRMPGPDHRSSLEPKELKALIAGIRLIEKAMGNGRKIPAPSELNTAEVARKSITASQHILPGEILSVSHFIMKRPGTGLPPFMLQYILGKTVKYEISVGTIINFEMVT